MNTDNQQHNQEKDILFSEKVNAGKRIYYIDVKKNLKGQLFLVITESKKIVLTDENPEKPLVHFEKHKVFLYQEDIDKFTNAMGSVIRFIKENQA
ncbi:PUR family DNA/RNA-binding protein [Bacteroidales bacterium OttesenSCG-928-J19]|nr:PUR family DNA/RNA-binding protein [Bacteroidales bacterium OttesenSCG-928-J19]